MTNSRLSQSSIRPVGRFRPPPHGHGPVGSQPSVGPHLVPRSDSSPPPLHSQTPHQAPAAIQPLPPPRQLLLRLRPLIPSSPLPRPSRLSSAGRPLYPSPMVPTWPSAKAEGPRRTRRRRLRSRTGDRSSLASVPCTPPMRARECLFDCLHRKHDYHYTIVLQRHTTRGSHSGTTHRPDPPITSHVPRHTQQCFNLLSPLGSGATVTAGVGPPLGSMARGRHVT